MTFFNLLLINNCFSSVWFIVNEFNLHHKAKHNNTVIPDENKKEKYSGNVLKKEYMSLVVIILSALVSFIYNSIYRLLLSLLPYIYIIYISQVETCQHIQI